MGTLKHQLKLLNRERFKHKRKIGLVLSGGCVKAAAFHLGVCWALQKYGFRFAGGSSEEVKEKFYKDEMTVKTYVGSSAGAIVAAFLASGFDVKTIIQSFVTKGKKPFFSFLRKEKKGPSSLSRMKLKPITYKDIFHINVKVSSPFSFFSHLFNLFRTNSFLKGEGGVELFLKKSFKVNGFFNTSKLEKYFRENVCKENSFQSLGVDLSVIATFLNKSQKMVFSSAPPEKENSYKTKYASYASISQSVAASASSPPFFSPYSIENEKGEKQHFFDGDIREPLSTHVAEEKGCDLIFASYSIQPYHYNEKLGSLHRHGMPLILNQALYQIWEQKIQRKKQEKEKLKTLFHSLDEKMKQSCLKPKERLQLLKVFESQTQFNPHVNTLYIHPDPQDEDMFFLDHFSLNQDILLKIIKKGFRAGLSSLKKFHEKSEEMKNKEKIL